MCGRSREGSRAFDVLHGGDRHMHRGTLWKSLIVNPSPLTSEVFKGLANPGDRGNTKCGESCTTSAECD